MDIKVLEIKREIYSEQIRKAKKEMKSTARSGNYFVANYVNDDYLFKYGYGLLGASSNISFKIFNEKIEIRALNMALAFLKNKKFSDIEKYYYNNGIQFQYSLLVKDMKEYSTYVDRKYRQSKAIDQARILLGSFKIEIKTVIEKNKSKAYGVKKSLPHKEFDEWIDNTGVLY